MEEYKVREWALFAIGILVMAWQAYEYMADKLTGTWLEGAVFVLSLFLIVAPRKLAELLEGRFKKNE